MKRIAAVVSFFAWKKKKGWLFRQSFYVCFAKTGNALKKFVTSTSVQL